MAQAIEREREKTCLCARTFIRIASRRRLRSLVLASIDTGLALPRRKTETRRRYFSINGNKTDEPSSEGANRRKVSARKTLVTLDRVRSSLCTLDFPGDSTGMVGMKGIGSLGGGRGGVLLELIGSLRTDPFPFGRTPKQLGGFILDMTQLSRITGSIISSLLFRDVSSSSFIGGRFNSMC